MKEKNSQNKRNKRRSLNNVKLFNNIDLEIQIDEKDIKIIFDKFNGFFTME